MATKTTKKSETFSAEEKAAMKERARELKAEGQKPDGTKEVLSRIAKMPEADRVLGKKVHDIVMAAAPGLAPKTWYGMPAYANADGKIVCFFQDADKFKARYATLGFNDVAKLDDGNVWPTAFGLKNLTAADEAMITRLVKKAVG